MHAWCVILASMDLNATVTDAVRLTLVHERMTRPELARLLGWHPARLQARLIGRTPWTLADLEALSAAFGIPAGELFAGGPAWLARIERARDAVRPTQGVQPRLSA
jgi:hypothetical protein